MTTHFLSRDFRSPICPTASRITTATTSRPSCASAEPAMTPARTRSTCSTPSDPIRASPISGGCRMRGCLVRKSTSGTTPWSRTRVSSWPTNTPTGSTTPESASRDLPWHSEFEGGSREAATSTTRVRRWRTSSHGRREKDREVFLRPVLFLVEATNTSNRGRTALAQRYSGGWRVMALSPSRMSPSKLGVTRPAPADDHHHLRGLCCF